MYSHIALVHRLEPCRVRHLPWPVPCSRISRLRSWIPKSRETIRECLETKSYISVYIYTEVYIARYTSIAHYIQLYVSQCSTVITRLACAGQHLGEQNPTYGIGPQPEVSGHSNSRSRRSTRSSPPSSNPGLPSSKKLV